MTDNSLEETRTTWNRLAADWQIQVGDQGDRNRLLNSDPVLWQFAGDVAGLTVLDAGCGTGYLSRQLQQHGANVIGVDLSEKMLELARSQSPELDYRIDSATELASITSDSIDLIVSNYVLMDVPDLEAAVLAFHRVLRPDGTAVLVFSHPCFPADKAICSEDYTAISYLWTYPYFERSRRDSEPWAHFTSNFIWFHRPLSDYFKAFRAAGFAIEDFEEPRLTPDREHLAASDKERRSSQTRPYSVAFKLRKG